MLLIVGIIVYFIVMAAQPESPPTIEFKLQEDKIEQRGGEWAVPVKVMNAGGMSVHSLVVKGVPTKSGQVQGEEEEAAISLLGPREEVSVTLWFGEDPRGQEIEFSVGSYLMR